MLAPVASTKYAKGSAEAFQEKGNTKLISSSVGGFYKGPLQEDIRGTTSTLKATIKGSTTKCYKGVRGTIRVLSR